MGNLGLDGLKTLLAGGRGFQFQRKVYFSWRVTEHIQGEFLEVIRGKMISKLLWAVGNGELKFGHLTLKAFLLDIRQIGKPGCFPENFFKVGQLLIGDPANGNQDCGCRGF